MYSKEKGIDTSGEKDLLPDEEKWICEYAKNKFGCEAVFATDFPIEAMKFYHKINPKDPKTSTPPDHFRYARPPARNSRIWQAMLSF